ncbi:hypothetical protein P2W68_16680 [Chryseobacterium arthrosphaerae]|uniref:hypothetical protein n=1 Tax=Chryseobacterium arthrosphaerae TaxID=651561 RepID=UPI0023E19A58|nr:hypothetical protein [Chryseobacterium arthrosphaerae]WES96470.1 hypothetical protein P2W68_16680 [Chryseobacterium arthrosphaerae]
MENKTTGAPVENTPSQTLFRFISLRSPELSDDTKQDKRFITIPDELKSDNAFYVPVVNGIGSKKSCYKFMQLIMQIILNVSLLVQIVQIV